MISVDDAKHIIDDKIWMKNSELIDLEHASGRIIAQNLTAKFPSPRFDNSAMDGYAVRANDTLGASKNAPVILKNIGVSAAGQSFENSLGYGECIQCMTGAKIPLGADAIVKVEDTSGFIDEEN